MKIKTDFVTNSSSTAFVVWLRENEVDDFHDYLEEMNNEPNYQHEGLRIWDRYNTKKDLYEYATGKPYDWVSKAFHPQVENMGQREFDKCLEMIQKGYIVLYVAVDYNAAEDFKTGEYSRCSEEFPP